ncbi:MAG: ribonuclease R [Raoultibacter sp.]|jgi:ribonuclease R
MARSRSRTRRHPRSNPRGILKLSTRGYGFVQTVEGEFFIPASKLGGAFDGDMVELAPITTSGKHDKKPFDKHSGRPSARVVRVIERAHESIIGRYEVAEPFGVVIPQDHRIPYDIFTMRKDNPNIVDGSMVKVRIIQYPGRNTAATGYIEEVIGEQDSATLPIDIIVARHKLETEFSPSSLDEAALIEFDVRKVIAEGYRDLSGRRVFTIDPEDARDFDDALSLDKVDGLWRLGVHIADVSRYVEWGSSIDLDARRRATSVYLVDRVIPMLPEALSNELCSLKPHELKATITVDMFIDDQAQLRRFEIYPSIIESKARFSYEDVQAVLDRKRDIPEYESCFSELQLLTQKIAQNAKRAGRIDFVTREAKVKLDNEQRPIEILLRSRTDATDIVEEAMILANTCVAKYLTEKGFPCVYRVHDAPSADSLHDLVPIFQEFDYLKDIDVSALVAGNPHEIAAIMELSENKPEEELISSLLLRSMKRARYDEHLSEHYGLALDTYCHFTSPIRRYPDLIVHRMLHACSRGTTRSFEDQVGAISWLALHSSVMERIAETASRESQTIKIVEYMAADVGECFDAVISGVVSSGIFVRLENTAEGLVSTKNLGQEYFVYDKKRHVLCGEESGKSFRLGQRLQVMLERADTTLGQLDFRIVESGHK